MEWPDGSSFGPWRKPISSRPPTGTTRNKLVSASRFLSDVDQVFGRIHAMPLQFPVVSGDIRRALLQTFPYAVYFPAAEGSVIVLAALHLRRNPKVWRGRVR